MSDQLPLAGLHGYTAKSTLLYLLWVLYALAPFVAIAYYTLMSVDLHYHTPSNGRYRPDFPSSARWRGRPEVEAMNVEFYDLADYRPTAEGWRNEERVLFLVPLRDASAHLPIFFLTLKNLTYPHNLIDLAFLVSDTTDTTIADLKTNLRQIQLSADPKLHFGRINIYERNFGQVVGQAFSDRHGFAAQGPRRKLMAIARNWLLTIALRPDHSWVYWRDIDVEVVPGTILEDLMHHDKDVIVPNVWRPLPDWLGSYQPYDLNSWQESEGGIELADRLDEDAVIVEGYSEYKTWRPHLAYMRDPEGDPELEMELDGIGGVSILLKATVFKEGAMFPAFSFQKHAETEAFGKLCKTMGKSVVGLPHYTVWHIYEPSLADLKHMKWIEVEEKRLAMEAQNKKFYDKSWKALFTEVRLEWDVLKHNVLKNTDFSKQHRVEVDWSETDEFLKEMNDRTERVNNDGEGLGYDRAELAMVKKLKLPSRHYGDTEGEITYGNYQLSPIGNNGRSDNLRFVKFADEYPEEYRDQAESQDHQEGVKGEDTVRKDSPETKPEKVSMEEINPSVEKEPEEQKEQKEQKEEPMEPMEPMEEPKEPVVEPAEEPVEEPVEKPKLVNFSPGTGMLKVPADLEQQGAKLEAIALINRIAAAKDLADGTKVNTGKQQAVIKQSGKNLRGPVGNSGGEAADPLHKEMIDLFDL